MGIQIINQSEQIGATETRRIAQACHIQLHRDVADDGTPYMKVGITETLNNGDPISAQSYRIKVGFPRRKKQQIAVGHGRTFWRNVTMAIAMR